MRHGDNEILVIQTSDSSGLFITKEFFPYDDADMESSLYYSIREGDNPLYWSDCWHTDIRAIINLIEFPHKNVSCRRDYISWWLNCRPTFVDDMIKPVLKQRIELYHLTGEIKKAFKNVKFGLEFNSDCLIEWHELLKVNYKQDLINLIPNEENSWYTDIRTITIQFEGFETLAYRTIVLKFDLSINFQKVLNYLYKCVYKEIPAFSYGNKWILYNSTGGFILRKEDNLGYRTLQDLGVKANDKIICYKNNYN